MHRLKVKPTPNYEHPGDATMMFDAFERRHGDGNLFEIANWGKANLDDS